MISANHRQKAVYYKLILSCLIFIICLLAGCSMNNQTYYNPDNLQSLEEIHNYINLLSPFVDQADKDTLADNLELAKAALKNCSSDYELYLIFRALVSSIKDGHSQIDFNQTEYKLGFLPITIEFVKNKPRITYIDKQYTDLAKGLELKRINDTDIDEYFITMQGYSNSLKQTISRIQAIELLHYGNVGQKIDLEFSDGTEKLFKTTLEYAGEKIQNSVSNTNDSRDVFNEALNVQFADDFTILQIDSFSDDSLIKLIHEKVIDIIPDSHDKLIIDIRRNRGGNSYIGLQLLNTFSDYQNYLSYRVDVRQNLIELLKDVDTENKTEFKSQVTEFIRKTNPYNENFYHYITTSQAERILLNELSPIRIFQKIFILTSDYTLSAAEDFVYYAAQNPDVTIVGEDYTPGSTGQLLELPLKNKATLWLTIFDCKANNQSINNLGLKTDLTIEEFLRSNQSLEAYLFP